MKKCRNTAPAASIYRLFIFQFFFLPFFFFYLILPGTGSIIIFFFLLLIIIIIINIFFRCVPTVLLTIKLKIIHSEGRRKKEEGRRKKEEGRRKKKKTRIFFRFNNKIEWIRTRSEEKREMKI